MKITENCLIDNMPEDVYHADPCPEPSLSSGMAQALIEKTEEEAMLENQRLNPDYEPRQSDAMDFGNIAHQMILLGEECFEVAPYDSWRKNDAKAAREDIKSRGLIALNESTKSIVDDVLKMRDSLRRQLDDHRDFPGLMADGAGEQSGFAKDSSGIWHRARFDWLDEKFPDVIVDYKTTGIGFEQWEKGQLWAEGKYMQNPHYRNVLDLIRGKNAPPSKFIWVVQQVKKPYHVRVFEIDDGYMSMVEARYNLAKLKFAHCLKTGKWRGQPPHTYHSFPPPWVESRWEIDQLNQDALAEREKESAVVNTMVAG